MTVKNRDTRTLPIICLFGPDGSGKTTLARLLVYELRRRGFRVRYSWMRGSHTFVSLLSRFLSRFSCFRGGFNPYYGVNVPKRMIRLWWFLEYAGALPIILLRFVLPSFLGYVIIADRYVLDLVVWIALITNDNSFHTSVFARHLVLLALRSRFRFFIVADLKELVKRSGDKTTILRRLLDLYRSLDINAHVINTTGKSPEESFKEILSVLENYRS